MSNLKVITTSRLHKLAFPSTNINFYCNDSSKNKNGKNDEGEYPEEPSNCCMSGCANCVWLEYAEKLSKIYQDGGEEALKKIHEKVRDPNIKAFLLHELRMRKTK